jgi:hypothetical protein
MMMDPLFFTLQSLTMQQFFATVTTTALQLNKRTGAR